MQAAEIELDKILRIGDAAAAILSHAADHDDGFSDPEIPRRLMDELGQALDGLSDFVGNVTQLIRNRKNAS